MNFDQLKDHWQCFGLQNPLRAVATGPDAQKNRRELENFFPVGRDTVAGSMQPVPALRPDLARGHAPDFGGGAGPRVRGFTCQVAKG